MINSVLLGVTAGLAVAALTGGELWGGYSGIFGDLDGHSWEIEHNPSWTVRDDGSTNLRA